jgi:uncharacterized protein (DUF2267 family)
MDYQDFVRTVEQLASIARDQAESVSCATLNTLAQRLSPGEARDLAKRLPPELGPCLDHDGPPVQLHLVEFMHRIEKQMGAGRPAAERAARAVLAALWLAVGPKEFAHLRSQLPGDFLPLLESAVAQAPPRPPTAEPPFTGALSLDEFIGRVAQRTGLDREAARKATEAALEALAIRVTAGQFDDLRPYLPYELRPALDRGVARSGGRAVAMSLDAFLDEVARREGTNRQEAAAHVGAVLAVLHEAVGDKEFQDTAAQLPREYHSLLAQA